MARGYYTFVNTMNDILYFSTYVLFTPTESLITRPLILVHRFILPMCRFCSLGIHSHNSLDISFGTSVDESPSLFRSKSPIQLDSYIPNHFKVDSRIIYVMKWDRDVVVHASRPFVTNYYLAQNSPHKHIVRPKIPYSKIVQRSFFTLC